MLDTPESAEQLVSGKPISELEAPSHIMKAGENLFSISVKYNVKLKKLLEWNGLTESDPVYAGTKIYVNNPNIYHVVKEGDTLFSISVKYNILMKNLASWNDLAENAMLTPNRKLLLVNPNTYFL
jgi:type IV pilus assembly protein PilF